MHDTEIRPRRNRATSDLSNAIKALIKDDI
jgi:hypothetical protein